MSTAYEEVSYTSPELQRITLWAQEQADLEIAKHLLTGPRLGAIEAIRRGTLEYGTDMLLYGNAYIRTSGKRVASRTVHQSIPHTPGAKP